MDCPTRSVNSHYRTSHIQQNLPLYTIIANTNVMRHTTFNIIVGAHRKTTPTHLKTNYRLTNYC